jgi:hypothetical protein
MILNPRHSVGLQMAQGHSVGAWWPAHFPAQGQSGLAFSVWPEADAVGLARALAGAARTRLRHHGQPALVSPFPVPHPNRFSLGPDVVPEPFPDRMGKGSLFSFVPGLKGHGHWALSRAGLVCVCGMSPLQ